MCSVRVIVNTAKERGGGVLSDTLRQKMTPTRMLIKEIRHIMDKSRNHNQRPLPRLLGEALPANNG